MMPLSGLRSFGTDICFLLSTGNAVDEHFRFAHHLSRGRHAFTRSLRIVIILNFGHGFTTISRALILPEFTTPMMPHYCIDAAAAGHLMSILLI